MLVTISDKSWSSKYYKWVTGVNASKRFKSLCPYFWTLFVYIVFSPFILTIKGIGYLFENLLIKPMVKKLEKDFDNSNFRSKKQSKVSEWWDDKGDTVLEYFGKTMMVFFILFVVFILVLSFIDTVRKSGLFMTLVYFFAIIGAIGTFTLVSVGIGSFFESDTWNIIKGMFYSVKNKVCPIIKWTDTPPKPEYEYEYED